MDDIYYEKILNRIIQGRLRLRLGDLVLFIFEPDQTLLESSFDIYDEYYKRAYFSGVYVKQEVLELLLANDLWSPHDEKTVKDIEEQIEDVKVEAFQSFYNLKKLMGIKRQLRHMEQTMGKYRVKKTQLDNTTCTGVASFARKSWLVSQTTKLEDGSLFDFNTVSLTTVMDEVSDAIIHSEDYRKIARSEPWRTMWASSKKRGDVFGKSSSMLDGNQLALISFSTMYDNVYESPDSPQDEVIGDDDCLDGWFITQRRKYEKDKKQRQTDELISNPKIANSQEIYLMASDQQEAQEIYGLNDPHARNVIQQRSQQIKDSPDGLSFSQFHDVKFDNSLAARTAGAEKMKGR